MDTKEVAAELSFAEVQYHNELSRIATRFRTSVLLPYCKKKQYEFFSGNGTFFVQRIRDGKNMSEEINEPELKKIWDTLNLVVDRTMWFGDHIETIRKEDFTSKTKE